MSPSSEKRITVSCLFSVTYGLLAKAGASFPLAILVSSIIIVLPMHWVPPRPSVSFLRHAVGHELIVAVAVIALWPMPKVLVEYMPIQLAYALPTLLVSLVIYFLLDIILSPGIRKVSFVKWTLGCLVLAVAVAGAATAMPDCR
jgi:hypothetical protein